MLRNSLIALALLATPTVAANAVGDAKAGAAVFKRCAVCPTSDKGGGDGLGPNLHGVFGRKAASRSGYAYSGPLQKAGVIWNEANLTKWVADHSINACSRKVARHELRHVSRASLSQRRSRLL